MHTLKLKENISPIKLNKNEMFQFFLFSCFSPKADMPQFSSATGIFQKGTDEFKQHAYQYATTSHEDGSMEPAAIIYPKTVQDICLAVKYANTHDLGIAVRTGGHQYSGKLDSMYSGPIFLL